LERRRLRGNLIEIIMDTDRVEKEQYFPFVEGSLTKGHSFKVRARSFTGL